ncbi:MULTISPECIES: hypothetical protein [Pseudomonas syringae group]|uniref:hypothetical protein n=1 Tax=Pseudomonas syringae group TaxID=136849 RepID=UPI000B2F138B|nr:MULTISPECIES: hypothetical protein [Pseudomonas syringae group]
MKMFNVYFIFGVLSVGGASAVAADLGAVSEVGVGRVGTNVVRYVKTFNNSCLEVQVVSPENNWKVLSVSNFCSFGGKSFGSDFADAGFEQISVKNDGVHLVLSLTPLTPTGEQRRVCIIPVEGATIKDLKCLETEK